VGPGPARCILVYSPEYTEFVSSRARVKGHAYCFDVPRTHERPLVFDYLDYRDFLRDTWKVMQAESRKHSYRWFSRKAGLGSPSYLKLVSDGDRNLTDDTAGRFAHALDLDDQQSKYFAALVRLNQASTTEERARRFEELSSLPPYRAIHKLQRSQYDYYALWFCVPIRELVARGDFVEDPEWIARQLRPAIKPVEAKRALALLLELELLERGRDGKLVQAESLLTTGPQLRLIALRRFHQQMLRRAEAAMDEVPLAEREVGGVTLRLTQAQVRHLKRRLYEVRQEVLRLDGTGGGPEAVHHLAFQLFPVTQWPHDDPNEGSAP